MMSLDYRYVDQNHLVLHQVHGIFPMDEGHIKVEAVGKACICLSIHYSCSPNSRKQPINTGLGTTQVSQPAMAKSIENVFRINQPPAPGQVVFQSL